MKFVYSIEVTLKCNKLIKYHFDKREDRKKLMDHVAAFLASGAKFISFTPWPEAFDCRIGGKGVVSSIVNIDHIARIELIDKTPKTRNE
jgi:hypothetical protein